MNDDESYNDFIAMKISSNTKGDADDGAIEDEEVQTEHQYILDPSYLSRKKMETTAYRLIDHVDLIEKVRKSGQTRNVNGRTTVNNTSSLLLEDESMIPPIQIYSDSMFNAKAINNRYEDIDSSFLNNTGHHEGDITKASDVRCTVLYTESSLADDLSSNDDVASLNHVVLFNGDGDGSNSSLSFYKSRIETLEKENQQLRSKLATCCQVTKNLQTNADLKHAKLELEVAHLRQQLLEEEATISKVVVINQSLQKQLNMAASDIIQRKQNGKTEKEKFVEFIQLHQRELIVEKHLNSLITSRNKAIKEKAELQQIILSSCYECRQRVPSSLRSRSSQIIDVKSRQECRSRGDDSQISTESSSTSSSVVSELPALATTSRPTYQSSARQLVLNQKLGHSSSIPIQLKSCLKKNPRKIVDDIVPAPPGIIVDRDVGHPSPTSTTSILLESDPMTKTQCKLEKLRKSFHRIDLTTDSNNSTSPTSTVSDCYDSKCGDKRIKHPQVTSGHATGNSSPNQKQVQNYCTQDYEQQGNMNRCDENDCCGSMISSDDHDSCSFDASTITSAPQSKLAIVTNVQSLHPLESAEPPVPYSLIPNAATIRKRDIQRHSYLASASTTRSGMGKSNLLSGRGSFFGLRRKKETTTVME